MNVRVQQTNEQAGVSYSEYLLIHWNCVTQLDSERARTPRVKASVGHVQLAGEGMQLQTSYIRQEIPRQACTKKSHHTCRVCQHEVYWIISSNPHVSTM